MEQLEERDPPLARALREELVSGIALEVRNDRILAAMRAIPRHLFVPHHAVTVAYADCPLEIGRGATVSQPSLVALMTEALELEGTERVLEIGTGSGYQAALLGRLAASVDTVELIEELANKATKTLASLGCANVRVHVGDGWRGWPELAPYDRILVTAAPEALPAALVAQLGDPGILVTPVGHPERDQRLVRVRKKDGLLRTESLGMVRFIPLVRVDE